MDDSSVIRPLAPEVIAQIKASVIIHSLNQVIVELLRNSLDASATRVKIDVDYARGGCIVEDDGLGIQPNEFAESGGLGKLYHTSKILTCGQNYGHRGCFLYALSSLSVVSITSHHHLYRSHNSLTLYRSEVISRQTPIAQSYLLNSEHGSRISVRDLFGTMPVRVKQRAITTTSQMIRDWEDLKTDVLHHLLSWPTAVTLILRDSNSNRRLQIKSSETSKIESITSKPDLVSRTCSILAQANLVSLDERQSWVPIQASSSRLVISGAISMLPTASKQVQFISVGIHPLSNQHNQNVLYQEVNKAFANSSFGTEDFEIPVGHSGPMESPEKINKSEMRSRRKGVDRWPMFFIYIELLDQSTSHRFDDRERVASGDLADMPHLLEMLTALIVEFLKQNHHLPNIKSSSNSPTKGIKITTQSNSDKMQTNVAKRPNIISRLLDVEDERDEANVSPGLRNKMSSFTRENVVKAHEQNYLSRVKHGRPQLTATSSHEYPREESSSFRLPSDLSGSESDAKRRIISSEGKIVRPPFRDVSVPQSSGEPPSIEPGAEREQEDVPGSAVGELVSWTNPKTGAEVLIDTRTGRASVDSKSASNSTNFVMPSKRLKLQQRPTSPNESSPWIDSLLKKWQNPTFYNTELPIRQVDRLRNTRSPLIDSGLHGCSSVNVTKGFEESVSVVGKLSKEALRTAEVISQVDKKYIMVKMKCEKESPDGQSSETIVLIDQHAADERCRIEELFTELCTPQDSALDIQDAKELEFKVLSVRLDNPIIFDISTREAELIEKNSSFFARWGLHLQLAQVTGGVKGSYYQMCVMRLPPGILERCRLEPKLLIDIIRTEIWEREESQGRQRKFTNPFGSSQLALRDSWLTYIDDCPRGIIELLNSRSCRSAIMFNDELSIAQCKDIIQRLSECAFPFQCAHGRPSMVPLFDLGTIWDRETFARNGENRRDSFPEAYRFWRKQKPA